MKNGGIEALKLLAITVKRCDVSHHQAFFVCVAIGQVVACVGGQLL